MNSSASIHRGDDVDESADILEGSPRELRLFSLIINLNQKGGPVVEGDGRPRDLLDGRLNKLNASGCRMYAAKGARLHGVCCR